MRRLLHLILFLFTSLLSSCDKDHMDDCFKGTGTIIRQSRETDAFTSIYVEKKVDVVIRMGSPASVEVEAGKNIIDGIATHVESNTLYIKNENKCNWVRSYTEPIIVYVTVPRLESIFQYGNGTISSDGVLNYDTLDAEVWSSGDISLQAQSALIYVRQHVSVGDVTITGQTAYLYVYNNGNGFSRLENLAAHTAQVDARGTGDTYINVDSQLEYGLTGSGNIYLYGGATASGTITGTGQLFRR